jgi:hypothetical protein
LVLETDRVSLPHWLVHLGFPEFLRHVRTRDGYRATAVLESLSNTYRTATAISSSRGD